MAENSKIPWPNTYLDRLQTVTEELRRIAAPVSVDAILDLFSGVTEAQIEAILAELVLFGRVEKNGGHYSILKQP